jgi:hypothetical protein
MSCGPFSLKFQIEPPGLLRLIDRSGVEPAIPRAEEATDSNAVRDLQEKQSFFEPRYFETNWQT